MTAPLKIALLVGARPNFMKADPVLRALESAPEQFEPRLIHSGQHYDQQMSQVFFEQLGMRPPHVNLGAGSGSHAQVTATVMVKMEQLLQQERPDLLLVFGDINSTLAGALAATKLGIAVGHVEAGLRSGDRSMPEEINRLVIDAVSDLFFTPSHDADENLLHEGHDRSRIHCVGNTMIDTLLRFRDVAAGAPVLRELQLHNSRYAVLTLHRPSNVDDPHALARILDAIDIIQQQTPVVFPMHPRTTQRIEAFGLTGRVQEMSNLRRLPPVTYIDFLALQCHASLVLTDSGGIQEEATVLQVPCLTLRDNTERPITLTEGTNTLVGNDTQKIVGEAMDVLNGRRRAGRVPRLWDGHAGQRIAEVLREFHHHIAG